MNNYEIAGRRIGPGEPPYIIAEIGNNHNGDMELCKRMIDAAVGCGVDAVKFQSWLRDTLVSKSAYMGEEGTLKRRVWEEFGRYQFTPGMHREIAAYCRDKKITFLSAVCSPEEVDLLVSLDTPAIKIPSGEIVNLPLLNKVAASGRPAILSTGMASLGEIENALQILKREKSAGVFLLHCSSIYPPEYDEINLLNMSMLKEAFDCPVGFSDHSLGVSISLAAAALGAVIIEKHFTLEKDIEGWDQALSADPAEMKTIVQESRKIAMALGRKERILSEKDIQKRKHLRRSVVVSRSLKKGAVLAKNDLGLKRPGTGISPDKAEYVVGRKLIRDKDCEEVLFWEDLE